MEARVSRTPRTFYIYPPLAVVFMAWWRWTDSETGKEIVHSHSGLSPL
jgi:hypothetical protein